MATKASGRARVLRHLEGVLDRDRGRIDPDEIPDVLAAGRVKREHLKRLVESDGALTETAKKLLQFYD